MMFNLWESVNISCNDKLTCTEKLIFPVMISLTCSEKVNIPCNDKFNFLRKS